MGRKKKEVVEEVKENIKPMEDDALNLPFDDVDAPVEVSDNLVVDEAPVEVAETSADFSDNLVINENPVNVKNDAPVMKKIQCSASAVNVRACADGEVLFTVKNLSKVLVEDEKDGWSKITGYVMTDLIKEL